MSGSPAQLTVRVVLTRAPYASSPARAGIHWGRVALALALVAVFGLAAKLLLWPGSDELPGGGMAVQAPQPAGQAVAKDAAVRPAQPTAEVHGDAVTASEQPLSQVPGEGLSSDSPDLSKAPPPAPAADAAGFSEPLPDAAPAKASATSQGPDAIEVPESRSDAPVPEVTASAPAHAPETPPAAAEPAVASAPEPVRAMPAAPAPATPATLVRQGEMAIISTGVRRLQIARDIVEREPVGTAADILEEPGAIGLVRVHAFSELVGMRGLSVRYIWLRGGVEEAAVPVLIGGDRWRSYSSKYLNADMRGDWRVELRADDGELLAYTEFEY